MNKILSILTLILFTTQSFANVDVAARRKHSNKPVETPQSVKQKVFKALPSVHGWCTEEKANALMDLVFQTTPKTIVEIGVYGGSSILPMASALKYNGQGVIIGIDPWQNDECTKFAAEEGEDVNRDWWAKLDLEQIYQSYIHMLKKHDLEKYTITLRTTSEIAAPAINNIDILHIDGNHYEESCYYDVITYLPKVKKGGYIVMDDTAWLTTQKAVDYLFDYCEHIATLNDGNCMIFKKN